MAVEAALEMRDTELTEKVRKNGNLIEALKEQVASEVARVITLRTPTVGDLRIELSVSEISGNLERMGDYAKNLGKRTSELSEMPAITGTGRALR